MLLLHGGLSDESIGSKSKHHSLLASELTVKPYKFIASCCRFSWAFISIISFIRCANSTVLRFYFRDST